MLATFKETVTSVTDKHYGNIIVQKSFSEVLWYWTKYLLLLTLVPLFILISSFIYIIPQLPKLIRDQFPEIKAGIRDGRFFIQPDKPLTFGAQDFMVILDPSASPSRLESAFSGILVAGDALYIKGSPKGETEQIPLSKLSQLEGLEVTKASILNWLSNNQLKLLGAVIGLTLLIAMFTSFGYWVLGITICTLWALTFAILARLAKKSAKFSHIHKLSVYASVPSLILSAILTLAPNGFLSLLNFGLFLFFFLSWFANLKPELSKNPAAAATKK